MSANNVPTLLLMKKRIYPTIGPVQLPPIDIDPQARKQDGKKHGKDADRERGIVHRNRVIKVGRA